MPPEPKIETPSTETLTLLQNRINELEVKVSGFEKAKASEKSTVEAAAFDIIIKELRAEIAELKKEKKAVKLEENSDKDKSKEGEGNGLNEYLEGIDQISL